jgi:hypothetical protein
VLPFRHFWCVTLAACFTALPASGTQVITQPFLGVRLTHDVRTAQDSPYFRPINMYIAEIDLSAPGLSFLVTPVGPDPRPIGSNPGFAGLPMETIRQTTRQFADSTGAQVAINTSFFSSETISGVNWANDIGLTASNGNAYSSWEAESQLNFRDALDISQTNQAQFVKRAVSLPTGYETLPVISPYNTVSGQYRLIQSNTVRPDLPSTSPDPMTAVGLTASNAKLIMVAVDGRQGSFSQGLTVIEMANLLKSSYGATNAISFDGGGSTTMVMNFIGDGLPSQVLNSPSDGSERQVGVNLGIFALPNGDYNQNGLIDAADYVKWRSSIGGQTAYDAWRARFGFANGVGSGTSSTSVPEPVAIPLASVCVLCAVVARRFPRAARR